MCTVILCFKGLARDRDRGFTKGLFQPSVSQQQNDHMTAQNGTLWLDSELRLETAWKKSAAKYYLN